MVSQFMANKLIKAVKLVNKNLPKFILKYKT